MNYVVDFIAGLSPLTVFFMLFLLPLVLAALAGFFPSPFELE